MGRIVKREELIKTGIEALDLLGKPGDTLTYVFYDIQVDRVRARVGNICKDYGLERIQFSGFIGYLSKNRREELAVKLRDTLGESNGKILIQPVCEKDFRLYREFISYEEAGAEAADE
ncbi:MAG: CRISPR-associated endonuclease Cas2 [Deltaproteobacteria bacterium]|nr:CRISPR-associated endonuclease Cas2 [Deltaproteobacteria bacterium]